MPGAHGARLADEVRLNQRESRLNDRESSKACNRKRCCSAASLCGLSLTIRRRDSQKVTPAVSFVYFGTGFDEWFDGIFEEGPPIGPDHRREKMAPKSFGKENDMTKKAIISKKTNDGKNIKAHRRKLRIEPGESAQIHQNIYEEFPAK